MAQDFDAMASRFTQVVQTAGNWKHVYHGAAYATRIKTAIEELETVIAETKMHPEIGGGK